MKQTLTLVALGAFLAIPAVHAQDNPKKDAPKKDAPGKDQPTRRPQFGNGGIGGGTRGGGIGGLDQLDLTAEQKEKVAAIQKSQAEKMQALYANQDTPREERATKMRELMQATQTQIDAVLTADQKKKQEELRKNAPQPGPGRRPGGKTNPEKT